MSTYNNNRDNGRDRQGSRDSGRSVRREFCKACATSHAGANEACNVCPLCEKAKCYCHFKAPLKEAFGLLAPQKALAVAPVERTAHERMLFIAQTIFEDATTDKTWNCIDLDKFRPTPELHDLPTQFSIGRALDKLAESVLKQYVLRMGSNCREAKQFTDSLKMAALRTAMERLKIVADAAIKKKANTAEIEKYSRFLRKAQDRAARDAEDGEVAARAISTMANDMDVVLQESACADIITAALEAVHSVVNALASKDDGKRNLRSLLDTGGARGNVDAMTNVAQSLRAMLPSLLQVKWNPAAVEPAEANQDSESEMVKQLKFANARMKAMEEMINEMRPRESEPATVSNPESDAGAVTTVRGGPNIPKRAPPNSGVDDEGDHNTTDIKRQKVATEAEAEAHEQQAQSAEDNEPHGWHEEEARLQTMKSITSPAEDHPRHQELADLMKPVAALVEDFNRRVEAHAANEIVCDRGQVACLKEIGDIARMAKVLMEGDQNLPTANRLAIKVDKWTGASDADKDVEKTIGSIKRILAKMLQLDGKAEEIESIEIA
jgi:hypothetical protein